LCKGLPRAAIVSQGGSKHGRDVWVLLEIVTVTGDACTRATEAAERLSRQTASDTATCHRLHTTEPTPHTTQCQHGTQCRTEGTHVPTLTTTAHPQQIHTHLHTANTRKLTHTHSRIHSHRHSDCAHTTATHMYTTVAHGYTRLHTHAQQQLART
jgi:hypothetical protein